MQKEYRLELIDKLSTAMESIQRLLHIQGSIVDVHETDSNVVEGCQTLYSKMDLYRSQLRNYED